MNLDSQDVGADPPERMLEAKYFSLLFLGVNACQPCIWVDVEKLLFR